MIQIVQIELICIHLTYRDAQLKVGKMYIV